MGKHGKLAIGSIDCKERTGTDKRRSDSNSDRRVYRSATDPSISAPIRQSILLQFANSYNLEWKGILRHAWADGMFDENVEKPDGLR